MSNGNVLRKYSRDDTGAPRIIFEGCSIPVPEGEAERLIHQYFEQMRQRVAEDYPEASFPNNEIGDTYLFLISLWADAVVGVGIDKVEVVETTPNMSYSTPIITINGEEVISVSTSYGQVIPEIASCLYAALALETPRCPLPQGEAHDIYGGTIAIERGDTFHGSAQPIKIILERAT